MILTLLNDKKIDLDLNDISSFEPETEGCRVNLNHGRKQIKIKNRFCVNIKGLLSIQQQTGFDLNKPHKKSEYSIKHNKVNQPGRM